MIHVVARSEKAGATFTASHTSFQSAIIVETGQRSYFELLNRIISESIEDFVCVVHDDVYLCSDFDQKVRNLVIQLDSEWPNWGLAGNAGLLPTKVGYTANDVVRYIADPHGGPNLTGHILPAMNIDGNVMLLNIKKMRERGVKVPSFDGFQLYDIILSIETISAGLAVLVAPQLTCWHGSKGNKQEFDRAKDAQAFHAYLTGRIRNRQLKTLNGNIRVGLSSPLFQFSSGIDVELDSLRNAASGHTSKKVAIVTRTQFQRQALLERCLDTINSFIAAAGDATEFKSYLVTDTNGDVPSFVRNSTVVRTRYEDAGDTRYKLVKFVADNIDADLFWFIDDDDWVLPNEAERLALTINVMPKRSILFIDCEHFNERAFPAGTIDDVPRFASSPGRYFDGSRFVASLSGQNHTPFCGVLFTREALERIPSQVYHTVTYYEDYMTILYTLLSKDYLPVVCNKLFVGISIRESGQTITLEDRSNWDRSMSEMVSHITNAHEPTPLISLATQAMQITNQNYSADADTLRNEVEHLRNYLESVRRSTSWRITRPMRAAVRLVRGKWSIKDVMDRLRQNPA